MLNEKSLDTLCAALSDAIGVERPEHAAEPNEILSAYINENMGGEKVDRIFMYNPDAIAQWIGEKYPKLMREVPAVTDISVPFCTVMPSVTPVCFGTMYTGAQPATHGITKYMKPVIKIDTFFDALIRAGKKVAIIADTDCSMSRIFLEREMDYFIYDSLADINAKTIELILEDKHDVIVSYNTHYDAKMHKYGPESVQALSELRANSELFAMFVRLIEKHWGSHDTLIGFAMDHGCHEIDGGCGSHGLDMEEDLNIVHNYKVIRKHD
jgi:predicted AlkP superfamily pyrophosphatase or phosphodiesterase